MIAAPMMAFDFLVYTHHYLTVGTWKHEPGATLGILKGATALDLASLERRLLVQSD